MGFLAVFIVLITFWRQRSFSWATKYVESEIATSGSSLENTPLLDLPIGCSIVGEDSSSHKIIAIGDIHGSYDGLLEDLFAANITSSPHSCLWKPQPSPTLLVQMGDMVDRGPGALESLECLRSLQSTASENNAKVVRLLGNHELWWLTGIFYQKNSADTEAKVIKFLRLLWDDILNRRIVANYIHYANGFPVMFVHAGYTKPFLDYLQLTTVESIANYTNDHLVHSLEACSKLPCPAITTHELYEAGPSRGGSGIGGPYWTDFDTLLEESDARIKSATNKTVNKPPFLQIVGHTMAWCYHPRAIGVHPPDSFAECSLGLVRGTSDLAAICVDGGMYCGARAFLEITPSGHFIAHERRGDAKTTPWTSRDLTTQACHKQQ